MNGARSTFMRKGYLLTALAAAVLLAASPGTALAQDTGGKVTITGPAMNTVAEGASATYTVTINGFIAANAAAVPTNAQTLGTPSPDTTDAGTAGDAEDISGNSSLTCNIPVPAGPTAADAEPVAFSGSCSIRVDTTTDGDAEDEKFTLAFTPGVGGLQVSATDTTAIALADADRPGTLTIDDAQTQSYTLAVNAGQTPVEGGTTALTLRAVPAHEDDNITLVFHLSDAVNYMWDDDDFTDGTVDAPANIVLGQGTANSDDLWIQAPDNDKNRAADTVSLTAYSGTAGNSEEQASVDVTFGDLHTLPAGGAVTAMVVDMAGMEVMDATITEGGDAVDLVISVDRGMGATATTLEALKVSVEGADSGQATDYKLSSTEVTLDAVMEAAGAQKAAAIKLSATGPDDDVGDEVLMLNLTLTGDDANGPGSSTGMFEITIVDDTTKQIAPKATDVAYPAITDAIAAGAGDDGDLNPGEMVEITTSDLFDVMDGYSASYGVSVNSDAVSASASGSTVTINALKAGSAEVTITGSASASSGLKPSQSVSNVASLTFPVEVVDMPLMITLEMPDNVMDGNIVEGETYMITAQANRMITEAEGSVEVTLMRDRSQSDADESDYSVGSATIMAGYDSAEAELMVTEDMMPDAGTDDNMGEQLVLYGMAGDMELNALTFTIWDAAVPALPLIAQILLALLMALGGARLYRRRQG